MQAFRPGTIRNRRYHWDLYLGFTSRFGLRDIPASPDTLSVFVEFLLRSFRSPRSVTGAIASVRHLHDLLGATTAAFTDYSFNLTLRALPLSVRHMPMGAAPCTPALLRRLQLASTGLGLRGLVFFVLCTVAFHTLARLSSLVPASLPFDNTRFPTMGDLIPQDEGLLLQVKFSKTTQAASQVFSVPLLPSPDRSLCPVTALLAMRTALKFPPPDSPLFLWPSQVKGCTSDSFPSLTTGGARQFLRVVLQRAGLSPDTLTFHSFRRGGCTTAAQAGATLPDLKALGHWRSEAVRAYLPALPMQLRAAKRLGRGVLQGARVSPPPYVPAQNKPLA